MKYIITRDMELTEDEIHQAITYWIREFCDEPTPEDRDAVTLRYNQVTGGFGAIVTWTEEAS